MQRLFPGYMNDSHLFNPCGFSMNAVRNHHYFTIHVTPQKSSSYASFDTNDINTEFPDKLEKILSLFKPDKFSLVLKNLSTTGFIIDLLTNREQLNYDFNERINYEFKSGYAVQFVNYFERNRSAISH
jgi:S-adenosylmethionine decarboxylase